MRIKPGAECAYAEFAAEQRESADGQTVLNFMEVWSGMMEYGIDRGVSNISDVANITLVAAAEASGVTEDDMVVRAGWGLVDFWEHGEGLREPLLYHPPEILGGPSPASMTVWYASQDLLDVLPDIVEAYPDILRSAPDILDIRQARMPDDMSSTCPVMSM